MLLPLIAEASADDPMARRVVPEPTPPGGVQVGTIAKKTSWRREHLTHNTSSTTTGYNCIDVAASFS